MHYCHSNRNLCITISGIYVEVVRCRVYIVFDRLKALFYVAPQECIYLKGVYLKMLLNLDVKQVPVSKWAH